MKRRPVRRANPAPPPPPSQTRGATATTGMIWAVTRTPITKPYPCRCDERRYSRCSPKYCPCAGRTDHLDQMPAGCCARRAAEARDG